MSSTIGAVAGIAVLVLALVGFALLVTRARSRHLGHSFLGPFEDMWNPASRRAETIIEARAEQGGRAAQPSEPPPGAAADTGQTLGQPAAPEDIGRE